MSLVYPNIQIDNEIGGSAILVRAPIRIATTANGAIATAYQNTSVVDGVALVTGNRILLKNQTTGSENGVYTVNATGAPTRTSDYELGTNVASTQLTVQEGSVNADTIWLCTNNAGSDVVGTAALTYNRIDATTGVTVTLTSAGGVQTLVNDGTGPTLATKGINSGAGIALSSTASALTFTNELTSYTIVTGLVSNVGWTISSSYAATSNGSGTPIKQLLISGTSGALTFGPNTGITFVLGSTMGAPVNPSGGAIEVDSFIKMHPPGFGSMWPGRLSFNGATLKLETTSNWPAATAIAEFKGSLTWV